MLPSRCRLSGRVWLTTIDRRIAEIDTTIREGYQAPRPVSAMQLAGDRRCNLDRHAPNTFAVAMFATLRVECPPCFGERRQTKSDLGLVE